MRKKDRVRAILKALDEYYPFEDRCYLFYGQPHELLVATILSAQCTDDRVNLVTGELFIKYPTLEAFASASQEEMERDIYSTGFYRNKAKNIISSARQLLEKHGGALPNSLEELTSLDGVGRKTANVIRCHIFKEPAIVVDTHVKRVSARWGLTQNSCPVKIEFDLMKILPKSHWIRYNHQVIAFGREVCKAPKARCADCFLSGVCPLFSHS